MDKVQQCTAPLSRVISEPRVCHRPTLKAPACSWGDTASVMFFAQLAFLLPFLHVTCAATHSLTLLASYILGETQFPELTIMLKLNDVLVEYYDSNVKWRVSPHSWRPNDVIEENDLRASIPIDVRNDFKSMAPVLMKHSNHTGGVHVLQELAACDVDDDNYLSRMFLFYAYDGEESSRYDTLSQKQSTKVPEFMWSKIKYEAMKMLFRNVHQPLCVRILQIYLQQNRKFMMRKVHPRVRVFQKTQADSGETQVICLATGFYPRHINLSLLRDERPVPEEHLTGGELLPNGDGTYQMRKSLRVSEEELQGKHRYTCTVTHLSPDNRLQVSWEPESTADSVLISAVVVSVLVTAALLITAALMCWRRRTGVQKCCLHGARVQYTDAQSR